jgi:tetratricopeptide (TPR) repeat protein
MVHAMTFGESMLALMAERGVSLRTLTAAIPADLGYLSKISRDLRPPSEQMAERIDEALGAGGELAALRRPGLRGVLNGQFTPDDKERLSLALQRPARLDTRGAESLSAVLAAQRRTEDSIGSAPMVESATSHLSLILRLLKETRGSLAEQLAATASDASQFVGWLYTATGAHDAASPMYDQSLRLGLQADDTDLAATALSMRGHLAWITGDLGTMVALSQSAADLAQATGTRAVAIQQRGRALALMGDRQAALDAIGRAEDELAAGDASGDPDLLYFYGPAYLTMQRGLILGYLAEEPAEHVCTADLITAGLDALPPTIRDSEWVAWYRVQAARARAASGEPAEAVRGLRVALDIVTASGGGKTLAEIAAVQREMAKRWPDDSDVAELGDALR